MWSVGKTPGGLRLGGVNYGRGNWKAGVGVNPFSKEVGAGIEWTFG